ncbi:GatB/YqeY domain-containing protein [Porphyromonas sp. COT-108 OH1349]|uniref:GatB/YqeY domain-containing protein n=1 Tax=Porphyromonas sp. COT-108 OH1349 TaxID=1537504 RepID=UPI00052DF408|nr:GatB/YqeY domain-containing protein [Porphyromonas sp. COT-108 OH1349]KGN70427.1 glutamyl-tRNA amidotransferase [Porphyromonas sp. COT-108 OH1349]
MSLFDTISDGIKSAMLAKDKVRLEALRAVKKEFLEAKTAKGSDGELTDEAATKIVAKLAKQRTESAEIYRTQGREDLAQEEEAQLAVLQEFLPKQLSIEEIEAHVKALIAELGVADMKGMGRVMGEASKRLAGQVDGKVLSEVVKKLLS